jgi:hypothetical protein
MDNPTILKFLSFFTFLPMKMEQVEYSETSAYKIQTPGNYPEENIQLNLVTWQNTVHEPPEDGLKKWDRNM